jgi:hypothetical protein
MNKTMSKRREKMKEIKIKINSIKGEKTIKC